MPRQRMNCWCGPFDGYPHEYGKGYYCKRKAKEGKLMSDSGNASPALINLLKKAGDEWGPLGVAEVAAQLTDPGALLQRIYQTYPMLSPEAAKVMEEVGREAMVQSGPYQGQKVIVEAIENFDAAYGNQLNTRAADALEDLRTLARRSVVDDASDDASFIPGFEGPFESAFSQDLQALINKHSAENISNTPDFLLRDFVCRAMQAANELISARDDWYHMNPHIAYKNEEGNTVVEFGE